MVLLMAKPNSRGTSAHCMNVRTRSVQEDHRGIALITVNVVEIPGDSGVVDSDKFCARGAVEHFRGDAGRHKALHLSTHVRSMQIMGPEGNVQHVSCLTRTVVHLTAPDEYCHTAQIHIFTAVISAQTCVQAIRIRHFFIMSSCSSLFMT